MSIAIYNDLPFIDAWLKVGYCFPSIALDGCHVIGPEFNNNQKKEMKISVKIKPHLNQISDHKLVSRTINS